MATYKTPGVYVEEISSLPPSVAEVSTAIPAFLGYTEKGPKIARINTLLEYESIFGKAKPSKFVVTAGVDAETGLKRYGRATPVDAANFCCTTVSVCILRTAVEAVMWYGGNHSASPAKADFRAWRCWNRRTDAHRAH
jgi:phage tail sheath protein FI